MYQEKIEYNVNVTASFCLEVRQTTVFVNEEGDRKNEQYSRYTLGPGDRIEDQPEIVKTLAAAVWTEEIVSNFRAEMDAINAKVAAREAEEAAQAARQEADRLAAEELRLEKIAQARAAFDAIAGEGSYDIIFTS